MLFSSFPFIGLFLPATLLLFYTSIRIGKDRLPLGILVLCSLVFYGYWNPRDLMVIGASIGVNYLLGRRLHGSRNRWLLAAGVGFNLGILGFFKYTGFFMENLGLILRLEVEPLQFVLPLGISFFTFQQIAFLVDTFRGKAAEPRFINYALFVSFFPQLVSGPIVHHKEMMPQFADPGTRRFHPENVAAGLIFFTLGLAKKVLIADTCGALADPIFDGPGPVDTVQAWTGALAYSMQLYFDFSGYTDMAIGLAKFFNIELPQNFNSPYKASSIAEFWRRWHITLGRFLREYLYIPLGGNRSGKNRWRFNILVTFLLGGLWHGANWTFLLWGAYHGILLLVEDLWNRAGGQLPRPVARGATFLAVVIGWVLFRSQSLQDAIRFLKAMFAPRPGIASGEGVLEGFWPWGAFLIALVLFVNAAPNSSAWVASRPMEKRGYAVAFACIFFACLLKMYNGVLHDIPTPFIYFNF